VLAAKVVDINSGKELAVAKTEWQKLPAQKRELADNRRRFITPVLDLCERGFTDAKAIRVLLAQLQSANCEHWIMELADTLGRNGKPPSKATIYRWLEQFRNNGLLGLVCKTEGRKRKGYGWEARALHYYSQPTKPCATTIAYWLRQEGCESATDSRVYRYIKSLPATQGKHSRKRMGGHYYDQNLKPYTLRDETVLPVGFIYEGDGHNCDVYVAHPATGKAWRPELTAWLDVRSHYVVGWWLSEVESGINTLYSLSHALMSHNHTCAGVHVDTGSGFKNRMMTEDTAGYLNKLSIEFMPALPGNAKGKGMTEGFFNIFEERCGKKFETYCGHIRTDRHLSHLAGKVRNGKIKLPSLSTYRDAVAAFIESYNNNPQDRLGCSPADIWKQLVKVPLSMGADALIRPSEKRTVQRWGVTLFNRLYRSPALADYNGADVVIEYDMHDDNNVIIRDDKRRYICDAHLVERKPWLPDSRIEDLKQKREQGQIARHQKHIEEIKQRTAGVIDHAALANHILDDGRSTAIEQGTTLIDAPTPAIEHQGADDDLDIFDTDY
jgi:putative transposase